MRWRMDLTEANMKRRLDLLDAIELAAENQNSIDGGSIQNGWIKIQIIEAPRVSTLRAQGIIKSIATPSNKNATLADIV